MNWSPPPRMRRQDASEADLTSREKRGIKFTLCWYGVEPASGEGVTMIIQKTQDVEPMLAQC